MFNSAFNNDYLVSSSSYAEVMNQSVLPFLQEKEQNCSVSGFENKPIYCVSYQADKSVGTVFIVHGFTENAMKYAELIFSLLHHHYSVVAYDQRGHGRSWRSEAVPDSSITHVDHFSDYVSDFQSVCDHYKSIMPEPWFLFAHSMGGAVASLYLEEHPGVFTAAVLSSPMIAPNVHGVPYAFAAGLASVARLLHKDRKQPFFMKTYSGPEDFKTSCATDQNRFNWYDSIKHSHKEFRNSVPSYRWSVEAIKVTKEILRPNAPEKIACPVLLCSADCDDSVLHAPQEQFIHRVPKGVYLFVPDSKHEIYRSVNTVLFPWWHQVLEFLTSNLSHS